MAYRLSTVKNIAGIIVLFSAIALCASDSLTSQVKPIDSQYPARAIAVQEPAAPAVPIVDTAKKVSQQPVFSQPKTPEKVQKPKVSEEDLMEEDLLLPEKGEVLPVRKIQEVNKVDSLKPVVSGNSQKDSTGISSTLQVPMDSVNQPVSASPVANTSIPKKAEIAIKIEDGKPINFAKNLKEYRSPKLAMLFSLLIPGLGQIYIGDRPNYIKAGAFIAAEIGIIGVGAFYIDKSDKKRKQYMDFADTAYSAKKMENYYASLVDVFKEKTQNDSISKAFRNILYSDSLSGFIQSYNNGSATKDFYATINDAVTGNFYVQGWKDCEPGVGEILSTGTQNPNNQYIWKHSPTDTAAESAYRLNGYIIKGTDSILVAQGVMGYSQNQKDYAAMVSQSTSYYTIGSILFYCIVLNHVISAADALLGAKAYNDQLLGKQTFWKNLSIEPTTVLAGASPSPGLLMRLRF